MTQTPSSLRQVSSELFLNIVSLSLSLSFSLSCSLSVSLCLSLSLSLFVSLCLCLSLFISFSQVSFSSRIPVAFPTGDANSLSKNILMYSCTLPEGESNSLADPGRRPRHISHSASASAALDSPNMGPFLASGPGTGPAVMMVSKHVDGSLNQVSDERFC